MQADIREKIKNILQQETYSKPDIVYFLVETYKLLEQQNKSGEFDVFRFYRNWTCHSSLSRDSEKIFEEVYVLIRAEKYIPNIPGRPDWIDLMTKEIKKSFRGYSPLKLKADIEKTFSLLGYKGLFNWESFRAGLYEIIRDTPLSIKEKHEEVFRFECKKPFAPLGFDDLELKAIVGRNTIFAFTLDDRTLG
jgi:hypothetical protein